MNKKMQFSTAMLGPGLLSLAVFSVVIVTAKQVTAADAPKPAAKAALTVQLTQPQTASWSRTLSANGSVSAWQEALIASELQGQRLAEVLVNVGDQVKRGQVLARFASETIQAEVAQAQAAVEEAKATLEEAEANAVRATSLAASGALSAQQITQYNTAEKSAKARLQSAKARLQAEQLRLRHTQVVAPDDGVISARLASLGVVAQQGQELFKMVRNNRLEWRAEVNAHELSQLRAGMSAQLVLGDGSKLNGKLRILAPTIDPQTRTALAYVDLPQGSAARAGMFASGQFDLGLSNALSLPQQAVVIRDGFGYVFVPGKEGRVQQVRVTVGRRLGERVEIISGITAQMQVVAQGAGFLADGDIVQVVAAKKGP